MEAMNMQLDNNIVSLTERKYIKMYKEFYRSGRLNLSLDTRITSSCGERRFVSNEGIYQVIKVVN